MTAGSGDEDDARVWAVLDLALRVGELLMASGEAAETVDRELTRLTRAYGLESCEIDVTLASISLCHTPGPGRAPVTAERRVRQRLPNYARLVAVHDLVDAATVNGLTPQRVRFGLSGIIVRPPVYPAWAVAGALCCIAAAGSVLAGGGPVAAGAALVATLAAERTGVWLGRRSIAEFYRLVVAAAIATLVALLLAAGPLHVRAEAVIIGVVIALIPGRALVAALQDGITGDVMTGTARLAEALFAIMAILAGIGATLYAGARLGLSLALSDLPPVPARLAAAQVTGAVAISVAFAVYVLTPVRLLPPVALGGALSWIAFVGLRSQDFSPAPATAIATAVIGVLFTGYARLRRLPALVCVMPCVVPLMPGTLMYRSMAELTTGRAGQGGLMLIEALLAALAIGGGVNLGAELLRVIRPQRPTAYDAERRPS
ncbi:threonine/serine ThrE exporter family protein [Thermomonospora umbrina]|uniref:Uncharacterized membrane protein YjjP (DUF1212 family) n=1 Tax=Thermomonospora umbrina TaxID=111806 RepID=A0A3D9T287_9ACTN|nr:threonine/serine exporter family protein [Thermomonospora umbrina]REF00961.1 uncharacterized membrane protein YjjP (DUF1212 family) [Thermomonospora umbrina]